MVLKMELRVPHLDLKATRAILCPTGYNLSIGNFKAHPYNDTLPPEDCTCSSKVYFLCGPCSFKSPQITNDLLLYLEISVQFNYY